MNVFDQTLLFEMSFALMRRFAFIEVASPSTAVFEALIEQEAAGHVAAADLTKQLMAVRAQKDLGPAVFMDLARFLRSRLELDQYSLLVSDKISRPFDETGESAVSNIQLE